MQESTLHANLKQFYTQDGGFAEWWVDGYIIDVFKDGMLIEIQTGNFSAIKTKLERLLEKHPLRLVYPIAREKYIVLRDMEHLLLWRRRSPRKGRMEHVFNELVFITQFIAHPNFSLELIFICEEEERIRDGLGSWRRKGVSILDRKLAGIFEREVFLTAADYRGFIPVSMPAEFTNAELSSELKISKRLASKLTYCLATIGLLKKNARRGNAYLYKRTF
jgi:hypothetical protein